MPGNAVSPPSCYDPSSPDEQPVPLPSAPLVNLGPSTVLQPPLTRRGHGPGLIVILPSPDSVEVRQAAKSLDPDPVQKWAEEGFCVVGITSGGDWTMKDELIRASNMLMSRDDVDIKDKAGVIVYDPSVLASILDVVPGNPLIVCVVSFGEHSLVDSVPFLSHVPASQAPSNNPRTAICHTYATASPYFVLPYTAGYDGGSAAVAHTRSLVFLRKYIGGPHFDLEAIWDEHIYFEFSVRSVAKTMGTMVAEPYVNHVPTMTGGMGRKNLTAFYRDHFVFVNPPDMAFETISRTVGPDRIVDEFIITMTHDKVVDWFLPGVPPSGKKVAVPAMSVVNVRGDRLYHEHIWWDGATALLQVGAIPTHLPYPLPSGKATLRLPIAGAEAARLLADETAGGSNKMFENDWGVSDA